jgi:glycine cleavage system H lipoate-binding protein
MPLSGQVSAVNKEIAADPSLLTTESWLIRIIPSHLEDELGRLVISKND